MAEPVRAFMRGLEVIRSFNEGPELTPAEISRITGLNRASVGRLLTTLEHIGYVQRNKADRYGLTPRILELGYAYVSSLALPDIALPYLEHLSERFHESSSVGVLDGTDVVYIARVPAKRIMTVSIGLGTRFPAYRASLGRALLADLPDERVQELWEDSDRSDPTANTVTTCPELLDKLAQVRELGYAIVDGEMELGLRAAAMQLHDRRGQTVAAVNISTHTSRTSMAEFEDRYLPALRDTAEAIDKALAQQGDRA